MKNTDKKDLQKLAFNFYEKASRTSQELLYTDEEHKKLLKIHFDILGRIINKNSLCLDVGCNEGLYTRLIASKANFTVGIDISLTRIRKAKSQSKNLSMDFVQADWNFVPFRSCSFDIAIFSEGPEHAVEPIVTLNEIRRVIKFGGFLQLSAPVELSHRTPPGYYYFFRDVFRKALKLSRKERFIAHLNEFTREELKNLVRKSNFCIVKSYFDILIDRAIEYPFRIEFERKLLKRRIFPYGVILAQKKHQEDRH